MNTLECVLDAVKHIVLRVNTTLRQSLTEHFTIRFPVLCSCPRCKHGRNLRGESTLFLWERHDAKSGVNRATAIRKCPQVFRGFFERQHNNVGVSYISSTVKKLSGEKSPFEIYGCGGGLLVASINATDLLEINCCYLLCAADARCVSDS